jgi:hypothetical protein
MRRVLAIFTALAVVLALATPASAKKGGVKGPPDRPDPAGLSCAEMQYPITAEYPLPAGGALPEGFELIPGGFKFVLSDVLHAACVDVTAPAGTWTIGIDLSNARAAGFSIKDSVPGDSCVPWTTTRNDAVFSTDDVPASAVEACGPRFPDPSPPLALQAEFRGKGTVTYTVTVPTVP